MAFTMKQMSIIVATLGTLSFMFGVIAENKKVLLRKKDSMFLNFVNMYLNTFFF